MKKSFFSKLKKTHALLPVIFVSLLLFCILKYPQDTYHAALSGLEIFLKSVFPALLPFFIVSDLMIDLGIIDFAAELLNPLMRPLFRCSGKSSFIWIMSAASGYPSGARMVGSLIRENKLDVDEGQRILSFCSTSGPLFMVGAVAVGMLGTVEGGRVILISHYLAAIVLGIIFRFYRSNRLSRRTDKVSLRKALDVFRKAVSKQKKPFGELMGKAVNNSVSVLLVVGGYIMLFSVVIKLMLNTGLIGHISSFASTILKGIDVDPVLLSGILGGMLEITTGSKIISQAAVSMQLKIVAVSFIIGWSGMSINAQAAALLAGSGIKIGLYMLTKLLHGLLAALISYPMTLWLYPEAAQAFNPVVPALPGWRASLVYSLYMSLLSLMIVFGLSASVYAIYRIRSKAV